MTQSDNDITELLRRDPEQGFRLLMKRYKEPVYWHIRRLVVTHADAQDATQETFVRIFRSLGSRRDDTSLTAWIYRIATNEAMRLIGRRRATAHLADGDDTLAERLPADSYIDYDDVEGVAMLKAVHSLPQKQQVVFNLRFYDELSYGEIAQITGSNVAAVKVNFHLAKEKIKRRLLA